MKKKDLDWEHIGFAYHQTDMRYVANFRNGAWDEGTLTPEASIACLLYTSILTILQRKRQT